MMLFCLALAVLVRFIDTCCAGFGDCGCLPGREGKIGPKGSTGIKGLRGDRGEPGFRGDQGDTGPRGPKGNRGASGDRGRNAPIPGVLPNFGLSGEVGPPGRCLCSFINTATTTTTTTIITTTVNGNSSTTSSSSSSTNSILSSTNGNSSNTSSSLSSMNGNSFSTNSNSSSTNISNRRQPVIANDYYLTDEYGEPSYIGNRYNDGDIQHFFQDETTLPPPHTFPIETELPHNGLFMMNKNGVLIPVTEANVFELFAAAAAQQTTTTTTTTTSTTTRRPYYEFNNNIYILGPKGTLIPLENLGFNKPTMSDHHDHNANKYGFRDIGHTYGSHHDDRYYPYKRKPTSSYNEWLRSILIGDEILSELGEENNEDDVFGKILH